MPRLATNHTDDLWGSIHAAHPSSKPRAAEKTARNASPPPSKPSRDDLGLTHRLGALEGATALTERMFEKVSDVQRMRALHLKRARAGHLNVGLAINVDQVRNTLANMQLDGRPASGAPASM